jgi:transcriptional regulator with XRE-family HTH domain
MLDQGMLKERLRIAREYIGLKQDDVANRLTLPRNAISYIETGRRKVSALELAQMAKLYQRPVSWFTDDEEPELPEAIEQLAARLPAHDRRELARFCNFLQSRAQVK